jgi:GT2 family glycosyltransferase
MTGVPPQDGEGSGADEESDLLWRLRAAEAEIEFLKSARKGHESVADELAQTVGGANQTGTPSVGPPSGGAAESLRALARRARRRLRRGGAEWEDAPMPALGVPGRWSGTESYLSDWRYPSWIQLYDTLDPQTREAIGFQVAALEASPLISVVLPVYNTPEEYLRQAIDSVRAQIYPHWELCISDDCSTEPHVAKILEDYTRRDERIRVVRRNENGHISASSNSALELANGSWICLMDHDDLLAEHALAMAVIALHEVPDAGILYSDEDHIGDDGTRGIPYFKPDYDPLLILGQNYFSHLSMMRADLVRTVGGFREGVEGSQDWDLVLRILEHLKPSQVVHVPHVLYHWRSHPASTASSLSAKPYVIEASRRIVQEHLDRLGVAATAMTIRGSSFNRIKWTPEADPPLVSIIVLPRSGPRFARSIDSVHTRTTYPNFEIVVIDDGAFRPPMRQYLRDNFEWLRVIEYRKDVSDSAQRNVAAASARGDILCFIHDDIEVLTTAWLEELVGTLTFPDIGAVGAKLFYPDLTIQHAGIVVGIGGTIGHPHRLRDSISPGYFGRLMLLHCPSAVSWACMAVRRDAFETVGGFDEAHFTTVFGDVDFCLRLGRAGWRTAWTPHAELIHFERPEDSRIDGENSVRFDRDIRRLHTAWGAWVENDPAYNPNLSVAHESMPLAWPPRTTLA